MRVARYAAPLAALLLFAAARVTPPPPSGTAAMPPAVILARAALDSMNLAFAASNQHWNELADLNTMERMLGTVRPTQREFLGCLQGRIRGDTVVVDRWVPARDMKQLQLAVAGNCDSVPDLIGTWHTHPFRADLQNLPIKERHLSRQDLETFGASRLAVTLVLWDEDSVDAAVRLPGGQTVHPAALQIP
jgi:proteasome lid subunit RPN8/RPN11